MNNPPKASTDLKPCPFCGGEAEFHDRGFEDDVAYMACTKCRISTLPSYTGYDDHLEMWNRRASPQAAEPPTPVAWQPIATAPRTGEHILVAEFNPERIGFGFCGGKKQSMMTVVHWWDNPGEEGWYASVDSQGEYPFPATHWKPLEELKA